MITVRVRSMFDIKEVIGARQVSLVLDEGTTVRGLLYRLFERYGVELREKIMDSKTGNVYSHFTILVDGRNINYLNGMETKLLDGSVISLLPSAGGGSA